ncbi:hypothetical protein BDZ89DRAFT_1046719 [Hymenopellis radicata]|nr:hypothetical protein BDZ89DRAFT_1046719 [Hymenopellis radicata]
MDSRAGLRMKYSDGAFLKWQTVQVTSISIVEADVLKGVKGAPNIWVAGRYCLKVGSRNARRYHPCPPRNCLREFTSAAAIENSVFNQLREKEPMKRLLSQKLGDSVQPDFFPYHHDEHMRFISAGDDDDERTTSWPSAVTAAPQRACQSQRRLGQDAFTFVPSHRFEEQYHSKPPSSSNHSLTAFVDDSEKVDHGACMLATQRCFLDIPIDTETAMASLGKSSHQMHATSALLPMTAIGVAADVFSIRQHSACECGTTHMADYQRPTATWRRRVRQRRTVQVQRGNNWPRKGNKPGVRYVAYRPPSTKNVEKTGRSLCSKKCNGDNIVRAKAKQHVT